MIIAHHVTLGMYGFWLPNDPRGSYSKYVYSEELKKFGSPTTVSTQRSVAKTPHDHRLRLAAKQSLKFPEVRLTDEQIVGISKGLADALTVRKATAWALAILPAHLHAVITPGENSIEEVVAEMKKRGTLALTRAGLHPLEKYRKPGERIHSPWARGFWKVYLETRDDVERSIRYVEHNPVRDGRPEQHWDFVERFTL